MIPDSSIGTGVNLRSRQADRLSVRGTINELVTSSGRKSHKVAQCNSFGPPRSYRLADSAGAKDGESTFPPAHKDPRAAFLQNSRESAQCAAREMKLAS